MHVSRVQHPYKGFMCLDPSTGRVYISRDVTFDENVFPFAQLHPNAGQRLRCDVSLLPSSLIDLEVLQLVDHLTNDSNVSANPSVEVSEENEGQFLKEKVANDAATGAPLSNTEHEDDLVADPFGVSGVSTQGSCRMDRQHLTWFPPVQRCRTNRELPLMLGARFTRLNLCRRYRFPLRHDPLWMGGMRSLTMLGSSPGR